MVFRESFLLFFLLGERGFVGVVSLVSFVFFVARLFYFSVRIVGLVVGVGVGVYFLFGDFY